MLFEGMTMFRKYYVNEDHNQHDDVQLDLMFHNDAKKGKWWNRSRSLLSKHFCSFWESAPAVDLGSLNERGHTKFQIADAPIADRALVQVDSSAPP